MFSNRQDMLSEVGPAAALNADESQELLGDIDPIEPVDIELPKPLYVEIQGYRLPAELLLLIASHLSLKDLMMLSQVNIALNREMKSAYIANSLYVSVEGVVGDYTMSDIQTMLSAGFPERDAVMKLESKAECASGANAICASNGCFWVGTMSEASTGVGVLTGAALGISTKLFASGCGLSATTGYTLLGACPSAIGAFLGVRAVWCVAKNRVAACKDKADDLLGQQQQVIESSGLLKDKMAIFGFFENPQRNLERITFYHKLNQKSEIPDVIQMVI